MTNAMLVDLFPEQVNTVNLVEGGKRSSKVFDAGTHARHPPDGRPWDAALTPDLEESVPITYEINQPEKLLVTRAVGAIEDHEMQACVDRIRHDARFNGELDQLGDYRGVTSTDRITIDFLRDFGKRWQLGAGARRAYVAQSTDVLAILRVLEVFSGSGGNRVRVFPAMDDAMKWLGRPTIGSAAPGCLRRKITASSDDASEAGLQRLEPG